MRRNTDILSAQVDAVQATSPQRSTASRGIRGGAGWGPPPHIRTNIHGRDTYLTGILKSKKRKSSEIFPKEIPTKTPSKKTIDPKWKTIRRKIYLRCCDGEASTGNLRCG
jgi:hypothetical protein